MSAGDCVNAGFSVVLTADVAGDVEGTAKVGWIVAIGRAVRDGATSTGGEQLARVKNVNARKNVLSFILFPFNKKLAEDSASSIVLLCVRVFSHLF
jgi:hypothetical protein